jgi:hypothetical protein
MRTFRNTAGSVALASRRWLLTAGLMALLMGCGRCVECVYDSGGSETICESEFDSSVQYNQAVDHAETRGATCTSTGGL